MQRALGRFGRREFSACAAARVLEDAPLETTMAGFKEAIMSPTAAVGILAIAVLLWGVLTYNRLVRLRVRTEESWRDIDTQLKRRWDLIPNLVAIVRGYASHESDAFQQVTAARGRSMLRPLVNRQRRKKDWQEL